MAVRSLREVLRPKGWDKSDASNFSTVINQSAGIRIAVASTDDTTGIVDGEKAPANRNKKGPMAERAASANQITEQFSLGIVSPIEAAPAEESELQTWHFCIYIAGDDVRAELSRFNSLSDGFLADCRERIILVTGDWAPLEAQAFDDGPDIDFDISRIG